MLGRDAGMHDPMCLRQRLRDGARRGLPLRDTVQHGGAKPVRRRLIALALVCGCGARSQLDAFTDAGPCSAVTKELSVPATTPWTDTGVDVVAGTDVTIHASGIVHYGGAPQQQTDANGGDYTGAKYFSTAVYPTAIVCSLIGRVGDAPVPDKNGFVGVDYHETMTASGRLYLGFNDQTTMFSDNSGAFDVTITTSCH